MADLTSIGGHPVRVTEPVRQGHVLVYDETAGAWINRPSIELEIAVCGKITSPDHTPQAGQMLVFDEDDGYWQPEG